MASSRSIMVDLTDDGDDLNEGEISLLDGFVDLTLDSEDESESIVVGGSEYDTGDELTTEQPQHCWAAKKATRKHPLRNGPIEYPFETLDHWPEFDLAPGKTVELKGKDGKDGDFVRIQDIILNPTKDFNNILIRGQLLRRAKYVGGFTGTARVGGQTVGGKMKRDLNELALMFQVDKDDSRLPEEQSLVTHPLSDVLCTRHAIFTHEEFPRRSFRETTTLNRNDPDHEFLKQSVKETGVLVCRYVFTEYFEDARHRASATRSREGSLRRIFMCGSEFQSGPSANGTVSNPSLKNLPAKRARQHLGPVKKRKITYGSGCCGAGGDCQGARWAGATVKYGWDFDQSACQSFALNHPMAKIYCREASSFPQEGEDDSCDILHLSWPCDYFSPNHTHEGKNDNANTSALFGTYEKLMSAKPRIHTQENTFGIDSHHPEYLGALIQEVVRAGYNARWKVDQFADHGSPASRKRLILIASRIGVPLPDFPEATHGPPGSGLARYRTVDDAIAKIPARASWHEAYQSPYAVPKPAYSPHTAKSSCVTRDGGKHPHPSGKRPFTPREMASLQGFPESYGFTGSGITEVKKQIGNAIPPNVWKKYIKSCVDTLEIFDAGLIDETGRPVSTASGPSFDTITPPTDSSLMRSTPTNIFRTFRTPTIRHILGAPMNTTPISFTPTSSSQSSTSSRSVYLLSPSPATRTSRGWSEESRTLSPEPSPIRNWPSSMKRESSPSRARTMPLKREASFSMTRPSPFKRKFKIDLTEDKKPKKKECIDLTGDDDWAMVD